MTIDLDTLVLDGGGHAPPDEGEPPQMCFNEAVAYFNNEPWSDAPTCVSPVIRKFTMALNDRWSDDDRQLLKFRPYYDERYREAFGELGLRTSALQLLDRLIDVGKAAA